MTLKNRQATFLLEPRFLDTVRRYKSQSVTFFSKYDQTIHHLKAYEKLNNIL